MQPAAHSVLLRVTEPALVSLRRSSSSWLRRNPPSDLTRISQSYTTQRRQWMQQQRRCLTLAADRQFGQPLYETHPHLLKPGQQEPRPVTPGITALEYAERRARLAALLPPKGVAVLGAADLKYRSGSVFYKFHQDSDFFYLTGFNEPNAWAVIEKTGPSSEHIFRLYVRPKDAAVEQWEGSRSGIQAAQDVFNADESGAFEEAASHLSTIIDSNRYVYTDLPIHHAQSKSALPAKTLGPSTNESHSVEAVLSKCHIRSLRPLMNGLRVIKSDAEIQTLRKVGQDSGRAFTQTMRHQFATERELESYLEFLFKTNGCEESAYVPVVAGGSNANQIHYVRNDMALRNGDLVVVDAGGEYGGYITDITRSWPVNGKFTAAQKDLYQVVLNAQRTCVSLCREDAQLSLDGLHTVAARELMEGLKSIGFDVTQNSLHELFPHHVGHHIGLAVHDAPGQSRNVPLTTNQCITIEPGIYVPDDERWPAPFRGMGIRIEDSVCLKEETPFILTTEAVKEVVDIEALRD